MAGLPFLVEHGWLVSKLLCAACGAVGAATVWLVGRWRDLRRTRRRVRDQLRTAGAPAIGATMVRGVIHEASGERWLVIGGERVELSGNIRVVRGTRTRWSLGAMSVTHAVDDGDEVIARGQLARVADPVPDPAASYRSPSARWVLSQFSMRAPIEVTAIAPVASPSSVLGASLVAFCVLALLGSVALGALGRSLLARDYDVYQVRTRPALGALDAAVIAAALPETRADALEQLAWIAHHELVRGPDTVATSLRLAQLTRGCPGEVAELFELARFEDVIERARACGDRRNELAALVRLGRYGEAAELAGAAETPAETRAIVAIAGGRWLDAAGAVDRLAAAIAAQPTGEPPDRLAIENGRRCLADLFRVHAGVTAAAERIHTIAAQVNGERCRVIDALLLPLHRQPAALRGARAALDDAPRSSAGAGSPLNLAIEDLAWSVRGADDGVRWVPTDALFDGAPTSQRAWLAPFAVASGTAAAHAWMAIYDVLRGEFRSAHDEARAASSARDTDGVDPRAIDVAVQLREGVPALQTDPFGEHDNRAFYAPPILLRLGRLDDPTLEQLVPPDRTCEEPAAAALRRAWLGDGEPRASIFERCGVSAPLDLLLAVLPRVTRQRERLAAALGAFRAGYIAYKPPFDVVASVTAVRDLARAAGDAITAARLQAIAARHLQAFADRDRAVALVLVHAM
jgi:hypothetical protein